MTRWMTLSIAALFIAAASIQAQDAAPGAAGAAPGGIVKQNKKANANVADEAISVSGKLSKDQKKGRNGVEKTVYSVTTADGLAMLRPDATVTAAVLDAMVGKDVTATGTGRTMEHGGKKMTHFKTLTSVVLK